jgi:hypothetical protein
MDDNWRILGASVSGSSHLRAGIPCQDAHRYLELGNGAFVAAVADGAGSAKHADIGALCAVQSAVAHLSEKLQAANPRDKAACLELLRSTICDVRSRLASQYLGDRGGSEPIPLSDLATTLLACFVTDSFFAACQIGDGAIVHITAGEMRIVTQPARGEYLNETTFVTSDEFESAASCVVEDSRDIQAIALLTDGIQSLALRLSDYTPFPPFFQSIDKYARGGRASSDALAAFLASERVCDRTDDDKTLVFAVRGGSK